MQIDVTLGQCRKLFPGSIHGSILQQYRISNPGCKIVLLRVVEVSELEGRARTLKPISTA